MWCAVCALDHLLAEPTCPWGLEMRWYGTNSTDFRSSWETPQQLWMLLQVLLIPSSLPIGPKKASLSNSRSWLAGIACISNLWSLSQCLIRFSCRRCLCGSVTPRQPLCSSYHDGTCLWSHTWEAGAGRLEVQGQHWLHTEFENSLCYRGNKERNEGRKRRKRGRKGRREGRREGKGTSHKMNCAR